MGRRMKSIAAALMLGAVITPVAVLAPASAFPGFGGIVFDPKNYAQNLLTAARTLQTINNQIRQLQNEAAMLVNDAKNLARLGYDPANEINRLLNEISSLMDAAKAISYTVSETDKIFRAQYPEDYAAWTQTQMADAAEAQWKNARNAHHDALLMQSKIAETVKADSLTLNRILAETANAEGNLAVAQAGNQLMALNAKQVMQMQELMAAHYRADSLQRARDLQIEREARVKLARFVGATSAYTP